VRQRLVAGGFEAAVVECALARLKRLGLVDDAAFAEAWGAQRASRGRAGPAVVAELERRGVDGATAAEAVARLRLDDGERARALAAQWLPKVADLPLRRQAARLLGVLARRGFDPEVAEVAVRAVLPPEGWD
jgi:regulatory protein